MKEWGDDGDLPRDRRIDAEFAFLIAFSLFALGLCVIGLAAPAPASAHPGGLAADGCHNDRRSGTRHCHRAPAARAAPQRAKSGSVYYANCSEARAAGAAPVRRGDPGYAPHLDRDNDGIGCE